MVYIMKKIWTADFRFASFRRIPEPRTVVLHLGLQRETDRDVKVKLSRLEAEHLRASLAGWLAEWEQP